ncbi:Non-canonical purine NTP pyrophosphatase [uncultured archaeon]|nr:Non-canonical purine NTP pyrophosphatase [uncultured archaeon]
MIYFVTSNKGKFAEASAIFPDLVQKNIGYTEIQADTLEEVAAFGMKEVLQRLRGPVMLEDAGLFIEALHGFPGVYSAYVQKTIGNNGILRLMDGLENRNAFFKSVVSYAEPGQEPRMFQGCVHGIIGSEARGKKGFGYDPIFYVGRASLGEMEIPEKNRISHRAISMHGLKSWLEGRK